MHRRSSDSRRWMIGAVVIATTAVSGCSSAVKVEPYPDSDSADCAQVATLWPAQVLGLERRTVAVQSAGVAAWGDPEIVARCGAESPGPTDEHCVSVNGVDWIMVPFTDGTAFVTYGRDPAIELLVPQDYTGASGLLPAFGPAADALEQTRYCS